MRRYDRPAHSTNLLSLCLGTMMRMSMPHTEAVFRAKSTGSVGRK